jgi:5'-nucleotidase
LLGIALVTAHASAQQPVTVTIVHTNDIHAHVEPVRIRDRSFGGYARTATLINRLRKSDPNVVILNAGDTFQGTLYFNVFEGLADLALMNAIGYQAMAVGNHEFDKGPAPLAVFARYAQFPLLSANLDVSGEPSLKDLIRPSTVIEVGGTKVGVVGATTEDTPSIAAPGPTVKFLDTAASVQAEVDRLTKQGINKIIVLSHIGYTDDLNLASKLRNVDLIVGGHSHTPLGTPNLPGWRTAVGPYPAKLNDADGKPVYVVQAWEWNKVVGRIQLRFDAQGRVTGLGTAEAIVVDDTIPEDPKVAALVEAFRKPIAAMANEKIGSTTEGVTRETSADGSRPMADVIADSMLEKVASMGVQAAFINRGGVRASLEKGDITYGDAVAVQPFANTLVLLDVTGDELRRALEHGAGGGLLHPSVGTSYRLDASKPAGQRVSEVVIAGQALDPTKTYRIAVPNFIANGGDGHEVLKSAPGRRVDTGFLDIEAFVEFIRKNSPLNPPVTPRVRMN